MLQYYDWENNLCHPLSQVLDDNVEIEEKDVLIPVELDPAQNSVFPDFEPNQIKKLVCEARWEWGWGYRVEMGGGGGGCGDGNGEEWDWDGCGGRDGYEE